MHNKIFDLTPLGFLKITGIDAKKFLQGQLTCNLDEINSSQSRKGAHCNPKGRIISFFHLFLFNNDYYLQMPRELIPLAMQALQKYAVFFKVKLIDASDTLKQLGYLGDALPNTPEHINEQFSHDTFVVIRLAGEPARYQFIGEEAAIDTLKNQFNIPLRDFNDWKALDITHKIPAIYPETSEKFLPHDLGLPELHAVSFNKGCYTGQEIIARMQYRGKLKNHLRLGKTRMESVPIRGTDIYLEDKSMGCIVDFCQIDYTNYQLLII